MDSLEDEVQRGLLSFYKREFPSERNIQISDFARISDGWENEVYSFIIEYGYEQAEGRNRKPKKREDLILRIYPGDDALQKSAREFNVMKRLYESGFPVPKVLRLGLNNTPFGKPFVIMEKIYGRSMWTVIDEAPDEKKRKLLTLFCKMFVDLHNLDWRLFVTDLAPDPSISEIETPYAIVDRFFSEAQKNVNYFQKYEFELGIDWLRERSSKVQWERLSVVHWDYHPNNVLLTDAGSAFVIDWGGVKILDFRFDLAWTLLLTSTYGSPRARDLILGEYERIAGYRIEHIEYFEVFACLRRLFDISVSLSDGATKLGMRPGAEEMMKKNASHIKRVYKLLGERSDIKIPEIERWLSSMWQN